MSRWWDCDHKLHVSCLLARIMNKNEGKLPIDENRTIDCPHCDPQPQQLSEAFYRKLLIQQPDEDMHLLKNSDKEV